MRELITAGHVYIGMPPLYKIQRGNKVQYAYDDAELAKLTKVCGIVFFVVTLVVCVLSARL